MRKEVLLDLKFLSALLRAKKKVFGRRCAPFRAAFGVVDGPLGRLHLIPSCVEDAPDHFKCTRWRTPRPVIPGVLAILNALPAGNISVVLIVYTMVSIPTPAKTASLVLDRHVQAVQFVREFYRANQLPSHGFYCEEFVLPVPMVPLTLARYQLVAQEVEDMGGDFSALAVHSRHEVRPNNSQHAREKKDPGDLGWYQTCCSSQTLSLVLPSPRGASQTKKEQSLVLRRGSAAARLAAACASPGCNQGEEGGLLDLDLLNPLLCAKKKILGHVRHQFHATVPTIDSPLDHLDPISTFVDEASDETGFDR
ncbi:hypothetical protein QBC44DRAFT_388351 [Cladorrhinum sp. PSN332]|nr:hypothetical protein QBC44DRAFT_388351 [Cladorrhinum sp. PSN332]